MCIWLPPSSKHDFVQVDSPYTKLTALDSKGSDLFPFKPFCILLALNLDYHAAVTAGHSISVSVYFLIVELGVNLILAYSVPAGAISQ
jgi:hypothetical protein